MYCVIVLYSIEIHWTVVVFGVTRVLLTLSFLCLYTHNLFLSTPLWFKDVFSFFRRHAIVQKGVRKSLCFGVVSNQNFATYIPSFRPCVRTSPHMCSYIVISKDFGTFDASKGHNCMLLCWTKSITYIWASASRRCSTMLFNLIGVIKDIEILAFGGIHGWGNAFGCLTVKGLN